MPNQTNKLFDWETDAEESLDENNLPIAKEDPTKDYTVEDYMEASTFNQGQGTSFAVDEDENEKVLDIMKSGRSRVHYGADDIQNLLGHNQSTADKWGNGLTKLVGKTLTAGAGGVGMLPSAISTTADWLLGGFEGEESWKDVWDNDYQRSLDSINEWMDGELPNYMTNEEKERAWYKNMLGDGAANFWANDVGNGLSFIAGAVLSEVALTALSAATFGAAAGAQGVATAGLVAKAANILKGFGKGKALTNSARGTKVAERFFDVAPKLGARVKAGGLLSRRLLTGAGYESGVEGRHHIDALHKNLVSAKEYELGRELTDEEVAEIHDISNASGNAVFAGNLALVGAGNFIAFPKLFGSGFRGASKNYGNLLKGKAGYEAAWDTYSKARKATNYAYAGVKRGAYEGFIEEGGQAWLDVAGQHSGADFFMRGQRPTQMESVNGMISAMYKTAEENFTSNHTQKEMGIGFILGAMGLPSYSRQASTETDKDGNPTKGKRKFQMMGGAIGTIRDMREGNQLSRDMAKYANENPSAFEALKSNYDMLVKDSAMTEEQDVALATNNMFNWKNLKDDKFFNYVRSRAQIGYYEDVVENIEDIRKLSNQEFAESFGYEGMTEDEVSDRKEKVVQSALRKAEMIRKATKTVDQVYRGDNPAVREAMAHALASVELVGEREESIYNSIDNTTNGKLDLRTDKGMSAVLKAMMGTGATSLGAAMSSIENQLKKDSQLSEDNPNKMSPEEINELGELYKTYNQGLGELSIDNAVSDMAAMSYWKIADPEGYQASAKREEVRQMLADLRKLRERRQQAIRMHNELNTVSGEKSFNNAVEYYEQAYAQQQAETEETATEEAVNSNDPKEMYKANAEAQFMVEHPSSKKEVLMKFVGEDTIQGVEDPSITYSSDLLKTNLIRVVSPSTVEVTKEPIEDAEVTVENSTQTELDFNDNNKKLLKPDFIDIGFGKTAGNTSAEAISDSQKNYFKYVHSTSDFTDVEIEIVTPTAQVQKNPKAQAEKPKYNDNRVPVKTEEFTVYEEDGEVHAVFRAKIYLDGHVEWQMEAEGYFVDASVIDSKIQQRDNISNEDAIKTYTNQTINEFGSDKFIPSGMTYTVGKVGGPDSIMNPKMKARLTDDQLNRAFPNETKTIKNDKYPWLDFFDINDVKAVVVNKKTGKPKKFNGKYVYTSMMLPTMTSTEGNERFSFPEGTVNGNYIDKKIFEYKSFLEQAKQGDVRVPIRFRSMLFPNITARGDRFGVVGRIIKDRRSLGDAELELAVSDKISVDGHTYRANPGEIYMIVNNAPVPLYHRNTTPQEVDTIANLLAMYADNTMSEDPNIRDNPDQILDSAVGRGDNLKIIDAVRSIIRFGGYKANTPSYNAAYQIKKTNKGIQYEGNKMASFKNLAARDPKTMQDLKTFLSNKIHDVNNNLLQNNDIHYAVSLSSETGLDIQDYTNYKEYLLAPRASNLDSDIPYTTNIVSPSSTEDTEAFQFNGGYLALELPKVQEVKVKKKQRSIPLKGKVVDDRRVVPLNTHLSLDTKWTLRGNKDGKIREAIFDVKSKDGISSLVVMPGQDEVMTALVEQVMQPNLANSEFTLAAFHEIVRESYDKTVDSYAEVKPSLIQLDATETNPFEEVEGEVSNPVKVVEKNIESSLNPFDKIKTKRRGNKGNTKKLEAQRKLKGDYKRINIEQERSWFEGKFAVPFNTMKELVSGSNYGEFRQLSDVMISEMAVEGTTFHEAFHVVHDYFLTTEEKQQMYNDYREYTKSPKLTDLEVEEEIAEEFRHYMLKDGLSKVPEAKGLKAFFKKIWDFIKSLGTAERFTPEGVRLANLFEAIRTTDYRTPSAAKAAVLNKFFISINPTTKTLEGANVTETKALLDGYANAVFDELYKEESNLHLMDLFEITKNVEVSAEFKVLLDEGFANMMGVLRNQIEEQLDDGTWIRRDDWTQEMENSVHANARFIAQNKEGIFDLFSEWLEGFGVSLELEIDETEARKENNFGATSQVLSVSAKGNASSAIKLLIASLPMNDAVNDSSGLYGLVDYRNIFDSLHNELAGIQDFKSQIKAIENMALNRPDIASSLETLLTRLKSGNSPSNLTVKDRMLQTKFIQQFDKTKNTYYLNLIKDGTTVHSIDSNVTKTESLIINDWQANFREQALGEKGFLRINPETGAIGIDPKKKFKLGPVSGVSYSKLPKLRGEQYFNFLELLGIKFTNRNALQSNPAAFNELVKQTTYIKEFFLDKQGEDISLEVEDLFKDEDSGVAARLNNLVALELPFYTNTIELQHITPDSKKAYGITLGNFLTRVSNSLSRGIIPQYIQDSMETMKGSEWLQFIQSGGGIKVVVLEGARPDEAGVVGKVTKDLTPTDRDAMYINNTLNGRYPLLQASEKKTVFAFELFDEKGTLGPSRINKDAALNTLVKHLIDEVQVTLNLIRDNKGNDIKGFRDAARQLRTFDFLNEMPISDTEVLLDLLQDEESRLDASEIVGKYSSEIKAAIDANLAEGIASTIAKLQANGMLVMNPSGAVFLYGIDSDAFGRTLGLSKPSDKDGNIGNYKQVQGGKLKLNSQELNKFLEAFVIKDKIAALEQLKLYFGDIGFFTPNSLYKRTAGPHGVKKFAVVGDNINDWLRQNVERYDKKKPNDKVRTIVMRDVKARSQYLEEYIKVLGPAVADAYREYNEADAQGYITIDEYIEFLARTGDITLKHLELFQKVQKGEELSSEDMIYFTPLKPQYYGPSVSKGLFSPAYYKLSLAVLLPQMLQRVDPRTGLKGATTLQRLHNDMIKHQVGIAVFESGVKIGSKVDPNTGLSQQFYGRGGKYPVTNIKTNNIQTLYYDYLGIQVDMGTKVKNKTSRGTQRVALILANLYDNGVAKSPEADKLGIAYQEAHNALTAQNFGNFVNKLGFDSNLNQVEDTVRIREALTQETKDRKLSDNESDGLELWLESDDKFLELLSNKPALDSVLHSLFKRDVIAKKYFGGAYAQVAATGMEMDSDGRAIAIAKKQVDHVYGSELSPLKFYRMSENGTEVLGMEIMLPHYFKEFLGHGLEIVDEKIIDSEGNTIGGKELLNMLGFRIPTSALNSIEAITIKGFLPKEAGEAVMLPSEIVVKAGSDFDIDKLSILFPNYTVERKGNTKRLVKIPYLDESVDALAKVQALRKHDNTTYRRMVENAGIKNSDTLIRKYFDDLNIQLNAYKKELFDVYNTEEVKVLDGKIDKLYDTMNKTKTKNGRKAVHIQIEDLLFDKLSIVSGYTDKIFKSQEAFKELDSQLASSDYFKSLSNALQNSTKALENRELDLAREITTKPFNFSQLLRPVGASRLEEIADDIAALTGVPIVEDVTYSSSLNFAHKQTMGQRFWEGMEALGIAATENTSHIKTQPYNVAQKVAYEGNNEPNLEELLNIRMDLSDGQSITVHPLGHSKDINDNHYVNEIIGEFINAFVDVANKPFVYGLNANMETITTMLALTRKGVSIETLGKFFMQPILQEFVAELPKTKSFVLPHDLKRHHIMQRVSKPYENKASKPYKGEISSNTLRNWLIIGNNLQEATPDEQADYAAGQVAILKLYDKYRGHALQTSDFTSMITYDTKAPMNRMHAKLKNIKLNQFLDLEKANEGILGAEEFLNDSWMSQMMLSTTSILPLFKDFYLTDDNKVIERIVSNMSTLIQYNSEQDVMKAISTAENDFITFLISSLVLSPSEISRLIQGPESVARRWRKFQQENPTNMLSKELFSQLQIHTDPNNIGYKYDRIRSFSRSMPALESNLLTEAFTEMYNSPNTKLAEDLVKLAIVQSGMNKSPISFMRIVPAALYAKLAKQAIDKYKVSQFDESKFYDQFYRNNWNNDLLVPAVKLKYANQGDFKTPYPTMKNYEILVKGTSFLAARPFIKTYGPDPSVSEDKKARLEKAGKRAPLIAKLYKRQIGELNQKVVSFIQVEKLGDGIYLKEYSDHPLPMSIIPVNNFVKLPDARVRGKALGQTQLVESQVLEGDIFSFEGIPVIPINASGMHSEGLALQAKRRNLIQDGITNSFAATNRVITLPVKLNPGDEVDMELVMNNLVKIKNIAQRYPDKKILLPLLEGKVDIIVPLLKSLLDTNPNVSIVLALETTSATDRGTEHIKVIKKMLKC